MEVVKVKKQRKPMTEEQRLKHNAKMREYLRHQPTLICEVCDGKYQPSNKHHHIKSKKHLKAEKAALQKDENWHLIQALQSKLEGLEEIVAAFHVEDPDYENEVFEEQDEEVSTEDDEDEEYLEEFDINSVVASELGKWTDSEINYVI